MEKTEKIGRRPKVELVSWTQRPIITAYYLWQRSKLSDFDMTMDEIAERYVLGGIAEKDESKRDKFSLHREFKREVDELFLKILRQEIPVSENIDFVFMISDDSIAHREQMVRHRIGHSFGNNFGVDVVPDGQKSSFWSQSLRILDMSKFAEEQRYLIPDSILANQKVHAEYLFAMKKIQDWYSSWVAQGIPMEDARNILPLGTTMDISWKLSLQSLLHVLGKRSCWILQLSLWEPIIFGMIEELCEKVSPLFREIILPPCFVNGEFKGCVYEHENERRCDGRDKLSPCPLYLTQNPEKMDGVDDNQIMEVNSRGEKYQKLWGRNCWTGEKV